MAKRKSKPDRAKRRASSFAKSDERRTGKTIQSERFRAAIAHADELRKRGPKTKGKPRPSAPAREPDVEPKRPAKIPAPAVGIYHGVPFRVYQTWDALNFSSLWKARKSLRHVARALDHPEDDSPSPSKDLGQMVHTVALEGVAAFRDRYAVRPEFSGAGSYARREEFAKANAGRIVISEDDAAAALRMAERLRAHPAIGAFLSAPGHSESCAVWQDPTTGILMKARVDRFLPGVALLDLKSTRDASPGEFSRAIDRYGYHVQQVLYEEGFAIVDPRAAGTPFIFGVVENEGDHEPAAYTLGAETIRVAKQLLRELRELVAGVATIKRSKWPGYSDAVESIEIPNYALARFSDGD